MTLLEVSADLKRVSDLLERLVVAVERAVGPVELSDEEPRPIRRTEPQDIRKVDVHGQGAIKHLDRLAAELKAGRGK